MAKWKVFWMVVAMVDYLGEPMVENLAPEKVNLMVSTMVVYLDWKWVARLEAWRAAVTEVCSAEV
jgi:hypothetical protein